MPIPITLDSQVYPHVVDAILSFAIADASRQELLALRGVLKAAKAQVDAQLFDHLTLTHVEGSFAELEVATPHGRHPALLDWPTPGAGGIYASCSTCVITNMNTAEASFLACEKCSSDPFWHHTALSAQFRATRIVDLIGATLMEGFKMLSSLFDTLEYLRFKPKWGVDVDMEDAEGMVWPKDMTRQKLRCGVKNLVWLGDLAHSSGQRCEAMPEVPGAHYVYVWRPAPPEQFLDYRLEVPDGVGRVTVVYRHREPGTEQRYSISDVQPYSDALLRKYPLTVAGLFETLVSEATNELMDDPDEIEMTQDSFIMACTFQVIAEVDPGCGIEAMEEVEKRLESCTTLLMAEYAAGLSEEERVMILE